MVKIQHFMGPHSGTPTCHEEHPIKWEEKVIKPYLLLWPDDLVIIQSECFAAENI